MNVVDSMLSMADVDKQAGVSDRVRFVRKNVFDVDIGEATVVTIYLLPSVNLRLRPKLFRELDSGTRGVSHNFHMEEWTKEVGNTLLYLWQIPETPPHGPNQ